MYASEGIIHDEPYSAEEVAATMAQVLAMPLRAEYESLKTARIDFISHFGVERQETT